jgi:Secretion system C-terminal sorting domain
VFVTGSFQTLIGVPANWTPDATKLTKVGTTTVYELTVELPRGDYEYKFINGGKWDGREEKNVGCAASGDNRKFSLKDLNNGLNIPTTCYNKCYSCDKREVTFVVDLSKQTGVVPADVNIAGSFQDKVDGGGAVWTPGKIFMNRVGTSNIYTKTLIIPEGAYEFKYVLSKDWSKAENLPNNAACAAGKDGNRKLVLGTVNVKLDTVCFNHCVTCSKVVAINDPAFDAAMNLFPNPTADVLNLNYDFTSSTSLNINIINVLGQSVYRATMPEISAGTAALDVHHLAEGTYIMQITDQQQRQTVKRFVIER